MLVCELTLDLSVCPFSYPGTHVGYCRRVLIWDNSLICSAAFFHILLKTYFILFIFFCYRTVWHKLTYIWSASTGQDVKVNGFLDRMEDEITEHFLQTVTSKVKVWEAEMNGEYFQAAVHSHVLIWKQWNCSLVFRPSNFLCLVWRCT